MNTINTTTDSMPVTTPKPAASNGVPGAASLSVQLSQVIFTVASETVRSSAVKAVPAGGTVAKLIDHAAQRSCQTDSTGALAVVNDAAAQIADAAILAMKTVVDNAKQPGAMPRTGSPAAMAKNVAHQIVAAANDAIRRAATTAAQAASKNPGGAMLQSAIKQVAEKMTTATAEAAYAAATAAANAASLPG